MIATARAALAAGTLVTAAMDPDETAIGAYFLSWYLPYSLALLAVVWTPARFAPGWDLTVHIVDVTFFSLWLLLPETSYSPVFVFYVFIVVCATLRWQIAGTVWTASTAIVASLVISFYAPQLFSRLPAPPLSPLIGRAIFLALIATLIGYLGTHQQRFQYEISRLASWPRKPVRDPRALINEIIQQSSEFLGCPRIVLVWEEPGEGWVNVAWQLQDEVMWTQEP